MTETYVWTILALTGFCVSAYRVNKNIMELRLLKRSGMNGLSQPIVKFRMRAQIVRTIVFAFMVFVGVMSLLLLKQKLSGWWLQNYRTIFVWAMIAIVALLMVNSVWDEIGDRKMMERARDIRHKEGRG